MGVSGHHVPVWYDEATGPANGQGVFWNAATGRFEPADVDTSALDTAGLATDAELAAHDHSGTYVPLEDGVAPVENLPEFRPERYGAVGDGIRHLSAASITSGTTTLTVTGANFTNADVGKLIGVSQWSSTIVSRTNATTVEVAVAPSTTYTNASVVYGTNDYTAIAAAITAARVAGGVVKLQAKHYCWGPTTLLPGADSVTFEGEGERASVLVAFGCTDAIFYDGSASAIRYGGMRNCHLRGFGCTGSGVVMHNAVEFAFRKVTVTGFLTTGKWGMEIRGTTGNFINSFANITSSGNYRGFLNNGQASSFYNCRFQGNTDLGFEDYGYAPTWVACDFEGNGGIGIETQQNETKTFINCYWERNVTAQLKCIQTQGLTIIGGRMYGGASTPTDKGIILGRLAGDTVSGAVIKGLRGLGHATCDIEVLGAINGCDITGNYLTSATPIVVDGAAQLSGDVKIQGKRWTVTGATSVSIAAAAPVGLGGVTPVALPQSSTADIKDALALLGVITNGGATPLNLDGGQLTAGNIDIASGSRLLMAAARVLEFAATHLNVGEGVTGNLILRHAGNTSIHSPSATYGGGVKVIFVANSTTLPTTNPTGGGILYVDAGALKWRGPSGAVTEIGAA